MQRSKAIFCPDTWKLGRKMLLIRGFLGVSGAVMQVLVVWTMVPMTRRVISRTEHCLLARKGDWQSGMR
jgi:hypothetical protein